MRTIGLRTISLGGHVLGGVTVEIVLLLIVFVLGGAAFLVLKERRRRVAAEAGSGPPPLSAEAKELRAIKNIIFAVVVIGVLGFFFWRMNEAERLEQCRMEKRNDQLGDGVIGFDSERNDDEFDC